MLKAIFATDQNGGFGFEGKLPWFRIKKDMAFFRKTTTNNSVLMGRKTYESIASPLPNRNNIILSASMDIRMEHPWILSDIRYLEALVSQEASHDRDLFIIGGASLLTEEILGKCSVIYHTEVKGVFEADVTVATTPFKDWKCEILHTDKQITIREYTNAKLFGLDGKSVHKGATVQ
jgi:dihydrofolate reductase